MKSRSPRRTPEKMKKGLLSASLLQSIRKPSNPLKKVNRSPKKNQLLSQIKQGIQLKSFKKMNKTLPTLPMNIKEIQKTKKQLKKTNIVKKSPEKSFFEQALAKKFININKKKSSDSDNDWSDGIRRNNFT